MAITLVRSRIAPLPSWYCCPFLWSSGEMGQARVERAAPGADHQLVLEREDGRVAGQVAVPGGLIGLRAACAPAPDGRVLVVGQADSGALNIVLWGVAPFTNGTCFGPPILRWRNSRWEIAVPRSGTTYDLLTMSPEGVILSSTAGVISDGGGSNGFAFWSFTGQPATFASFGTGPIGDGRTVYERDRIADIWIGQDAAGGVIAIDVDGIVVTQDITTDPWNPHVAGTATKFAVSARTPLGSWFGVFENPLPISVAPFGRALHSGYIYAISDRYGDATGLHETCTVIVDEPGSSPNTPAGKVARTTKLIIPDIVTAPAVPIERLLAVWAEGNSVGSVQTAAANAAVVARGQPVLGVCDGFTPAGPITGCTWLGIEAYPLTATETAAAMKARVKASLTAVAAVPVMLIGNAYSHSTDGFTVWYQGDLAALQRACAELMAEHTNVIGVLWFSAMRPSGIIDYPQLGAYPEAVYAAIANVTPPPPAPAPPPTPAPAPPAPAPGPATAGSYTAGPGQGPSNPALTTLHPPLRDPVTVGDSRQATREYARWFLEVQNRLNRSAQVVTGSTALRPAAGSVTDGTFWWDEDRTVLYVAKGGVWKYVAGIMRTVAGDVPIEGSTPVTPPTPPAPTPATTPPTSPSSPSPADGARDIGTHTSLGWTAPGATSYDVRFGRSTPPSSVSTGQTGASYTPTLEYNALYYWQIVAHNSAGTTVGPIWSFSTGLQPSSNVPSLPASPTPADTATGVSRRPTLGWTATNATMYDVYIGTVNPPPRRSTNQAGTSYRPALLDPSTLYYWKVSAKNAAGESPGPVWTFTTGAAVPTTGDRLYADGLELKLESTGAVWFGLGVTAFPLLQEYLDHGGGPGTKVQIFTDWMVSSGLEVARALGMYWGALGQFNPLSYGAAYFTGLDGLVEYMAAKNLRLKLSVFADCQQGGGTLPNNPLTAINQVSFFDQVAATVNGAWNVILDGGNEYTKNGWDPQALNRPTGVLAGRGSPETDVAPPANPWDEFEFHGARNDGWPKALKAVYDCQHPGSAGVWAVPGGLDEMIGIGEADEAGRTTDSADDIFDMVASPFGSYVILHVRSGMTLDVPGPVAQACVDAAVAAAAIMPATFRQGTYVRGGPGGGGLAIVDSPTGADGEPEWWLRAYGSTIGNEQWGVALRPTGSFPGLTAAAGWSIVTYGARNNIWHATRL